ncbi:HobA family DNA replication regulator [Helicobacter bizzozeronii]|uniref:HobA family DNA replication regulator n=1 Tax=Helicobacter bizzozeronii TaxID=56877 RepID=UPI000CED9568|nr:HobA family DNA replication regulator [Helicobacter bizzozeronii]
MIAFAKWLQKIKDNLSCPLDWLERVDWTRFIATTQHLAQGGCLLIGADLERTWFKIYVLSHLNRHKLRPLVPIFDTPSAFEGFLNTKDDSSNLALITHMLNLSYQSCALWYVGLAHTPLAQLALSLDQHFLWILDTPHKEAISLHSLDPMLDFKMLQLYQIFENLLFDVLLGRLEL